VRKERIYVGAFELFRDNGINPLVRETLHITDGDHRFALVETRTDTPAPQQLIRYQFDNHLEASSLELDGAAAIISYEEYTPYGSTSFQVVSGQLRVPKRYRFIGKERDEESGLYYHGARYYVPWLERWLSTDPIGIGDGTNLYVYCTSNPIRHLDRTGDEGEEAAPSNWDRFLGGLKMVGGGLETAAGVGLVAAGVATGWTGVGLGLAGAGAFVTAHGADTTVSGARTMWNGKPVDSFTSQGLQQVGMSRTAANLTDAGISVVGTLGANLATRAPAVATVAAEGSSVSVSHAAGAPSALGVTNPLGYAVGHSRVGVDLGEGAGTVWSHLTVPGERVMSSSGQLVESGTAVISEGATVTPKFASVVTIPVSAAEARAAQSLVTASVGEAGSYAFLANDCTTYAGSVLNAAGVQASGLTPSALFVSAALRSEAPVSTLLTSATVMQPVTTAGVVVNTAVGAGSLTATPRSSSTTSSGSSNGASPVGSGIPNPAAFHSFDEFQAAASGPYSQDYLMQQWAAIHGWVSAD
jgi:RHS repeat-associated protein